MGHANETNDSGSTFNATGEHSGDVIDTSSSSHTDSDADASASFPSHKLKRMVALFMSYFQQFLQ